MELLVKGKKFFASRLEEEEMTVIFECGYIHEETEEFINEMDIEITEENELVMIPKYKFVNYHWGEPDEETILDYIGDYLDGKQL